MISPLVRASTEPAVLPELDADGALAVEDHLLDQHSGLEAQVGAVEHGLQEGAGRGPAHTALLVDVEIADPGIVAGVEIRRRRNAHLDRRPGDGIQHIPLHARLLDPPFAAGAVMLGVAEEMIVEPLEDRADIVPAPAGEPELAPVIVVLRLTAHRDHGVDRRAAADHLAAGVFQAAPVQARLLLGFEHPVRPRIADGKQIAHRNVEPDPVVPAAGFQEQHARTGVRRETIGQHTAGGARADDDVVEVAFETRRGFSGHSAFLAVGSPDGPHSS